VFNSLTTELEGEAIGPAQSWPSKLRRAGSTCRVGIRLLDRRPIVTEHPQFARSSGLRRQVRRDIITVSTSAATNGHRLRIGRRQRQGATIESKPAGAVRTPRSRPAAPAHGDGAIVRRRADRAGETTLGTPCRSAATAVGLVGRNRLLIADR
jgi:hypothetical protein